MPHYRYTGLDDQLPATHWKKRVRSFTWSLFMINMGTGGLYDLLYLIPYRFEGLIVLGDILLIFNIVIFLINVTGLTARFIMSPKSFKNSLLHPMESCFVPAFPLAIATLDSGFITYAKSKSGIGFWIVTTTEVIFWIYLAIALLCSFTVPLIQAQAQRHPLNEFTPLWMLPALGVTFAGTLCYDISSFLPSYSSIYMIVTGYVCLGIGFFVALLYTAGYLIRLICFGPPQPKQVQLMLIAVGPCGWTATGLLGLGDLANDVFPAQSPLFAASQQSGVIFSQASLLLALLLWGFGWWLLMIGLLQLGYTILKGEFGITLGIWSITFPVAGHVAATFLLGDKLDSRFIKDLGLVQFFFYLLFWLSAIGMTLLGLLQGRILAEGMDFNAPQGGFMGDFEAIDDEEGMVEKGRRDAHKERSVDQSRQQESSPSQTDRTEVAVH